MAWRHGRWYTAGPLSSTRAFLGLAAAVVLSGAPASALEAEPSPESPPAAAAPRAALAEEVSALRDDVGALWHQVDRLTDGSEPPRWASTEHERLHARLERITILLEGLSARVEAPVPRLDEPFTLFTVSLCALVLGFLGGRSLQRRSHRKDSRFRL
jgi:hypothetical protein